MQVTIRPGSNSTSPLPHAGADDEERAAAKQSRTVTARAVATTFALIPLNAYWIVQMERVRYSAHPTTISMFFNCVFILCVLTGLNAIVRRYRPERAFNPGELLLIYSGITVATCVGGHDFIQVLVPHMTWVYHEANAVNGYRELLWPHLPTWALVSNVHGTDGFYFGHDTLYTREHLLTWISPTLIWVAFIGTLLFVLQCVNVLIRKQWTENERLIYPLVKLPVEIASSSLDSASEERKPIFRNRLFWIGFAIAATIDLINSLNYYYPVIPPIMTPGNGQSSLDLSSYLPYKPWNAIGWTPVSYYPFIIGLGMLMPMDFLFSSWFFYLTWKLQSIAVVSGGWDSDPRMPYANYQALGGYLAFFVSTVVISRGYFVQVLRRAFGMSSSLDDSDEPLRYRVALWGIAGGLVALMAFSMALGLSWWLAIAFFALYLALALSITRMRAELGTPVHDLHFTGPDWALTDLIGPRALGPSNLAAFSALFWFNRAYRCHPMPAQLEGFKMAESSGGSKEYGKWFWFMLGCGVFGSVAAFWAILHNYYIYGASAKVFYAGGPDAWDRYRGWMTSYRFGGTRVAEAIGVGFLFASFLQAARVRFAWWPFHPLAYAVSGSWEMNLVWLPLMIAYIVKVIIFRYGGIRSYRAALPFFYGLILGQFIPGSLLNIWGIATGTPTYQFWQ